METNVVVSRGCDMERRRFYAWRQQIGTLMLWDDVDILRRIPN